MPARSSVCVLVPCVALVLWDVLFDDQFAPRTPRVRVDERLYAVLHVGPHKCASSYLQYNIYKQFRDEVEIDGFALPSPSDIPGGFLGSKQFANKAFMLHTGHEDDIASAKWINVTEFFDRAHRAQKPLVISSEELDRSYVRFPLLKTILAPWRTHVVVIYRPFYDWVSSEHNSLWKTRKISEPLAQWVTFDRLSLLASNESFFSVAVRNRYLCHGFRVTALALNSSLLLDFVCGVMGASRTCQKLREVPTEKKNVRVTPPCKAKPCLSSDKLELMLNLSVELDAAMQAEVQRGEPFLRFDFQNKVRSEYFCTCAADRNSLER